MVSQNSITEKLNNNFSYVAALGFFKLLRSFILVYSSALLGGMIGPIGMGKWAMILSLSLLLHTLFIGWSYPLTLRLGIDQIKSSLSLDKVYKTKNLALFIGLIIIISILCIDPLDLISKLYGLNNKKLLFIVFIYIISQILLNEFQTIMQIRQSFYYLAIIQLIFDICIIFVIYIFYFIELRNFYIIFTSIITLNIILYLYGISKNITINKFEFSISKIEISNLFKIGLPVSIALIFGYITDWVNQVVLRIYYGDDFVGQFQVSYSLFLIMSGAISPIIVVILPKLILISNKHKRFYKFYVKRLIPFIYMPMLILGFFFITFSDFIIRSMYDERYSLSPFVINYLAVLLPSSFLSALYGVLYTAQNRLRFLALINIYMACGNLFLSLIFVPRMGIEGAVLSSLITYSIVHLLYVYDQTRFVDLANKFVYKFILILFLALSSAISNNIYYKSILFLSIVITVILYFYNNKKRMIKIYNFLVQ
jgi:O-antigen/teichoic acid export membrane protein